MRFSVITVAVVIYVIAIVAYAFMNVQDSFWAVYHNWVGTFCFLIPVYAVYRLMVHKIKLNDLEMGLIYGMAIVKIFSSTTFNVWFLTGNALTENPNVYTIMVCVAFLLGLIIRYIRAGYGKDN